jgi:hypothetical protein
MKLLDLFIAETEQLDEIDMSPSSLRKLSSVIDARAGMEFEMIVPNVEGDDEDVDMEPDYEYDESVSSIQEAYDFFYDGDYNSRRDCERLRETMSDSYQDWLGGQVGDQWEEGKVEAIYDHLRYNAAPSEVFGILGRKEDEQGNYPDPEKKDYGDAAKKVAEDQISPWYEDAEADFMDNFYSNGDLESEWLEQEGITTMQDVESNFDIQWPHYSSPGNGGELSIDDVADSFSRAIGRPINSSQRYHGARREPGHYVVEPDGSLEGDDYGDSGLEFVSPPLPLGELLTDLEKVKDWASRNNCYTNESTGLHINVSVPGLRGIAENLDYVKLALLLGDNYILESFGRTGNTYCKSAVDIVKERVVQRPEDAKALLDKMRGHLNDMASKAIHSGATSKYTSINTKEGYVEFRSPGGDWLGELAAGEGKIQNTLLRFVVALDAAIDPEKYRTEYLKKLYKILQPKTDTDTMAYFARYAAGELPKQALKSFVRQAQFERKVNADKVGGKKYWWSVGRPGYGASAEVVASSREEAIEKGRAEYPDWANATNITAKPLRPYDGADTVQPSGPTLNGRPSNPDGNWVIVARQSPRTPVYRYMALNDNDAMIVLRQWIQANPGTEWGFARDANQSLGQTGAAQSANASNRYEIYNKQTGNSVEDAEGITNDEEALVRLNDYIEHGPHALQRGQAERMFGIRTVGGVGIVDIDIPVAQGRVATSPTGQWKIVDGLNREVYRFRAAENTRAKANELAALWARENDFDGNYQVEPVEHDDVTPVTPAPGSTADLAQRRAQGGEFTGAWRVSIDGEEVHRFSGIGNNQGDANRIGRDWIIGQVRQGTLRPATYAEIEITPIMS